jgi:hypothetical protein
MSQLADEVVPVDLRDRSLTTARSIGVRRAAFATSAAVAILLAAAGTAIAFRPTNQNAVPPGGPTGSVTEAPPPITLDSTVYYLVRTGDQLQVRSFAGGRIGQHHTVTARADDPCVENSLVVSPDGGSVAWVSGTGPDSVRGVLTVARLDGTNQHTVDTIVCELDDTNWTPDPLRLRATAQGATRVDVDPATGATVPAPQDFSVWSANRAYRAYQATSGGRPLVVEDASGQSVHRVDYTGDNQTCGYSIRALSDDGRHVIIGDCNTDPDRVLFGRVLLDTVTGRPVDLPDPDATVLGFAGGNVVLRTATGLVLVDPSGRVLDRVAAPAEVTRAEIIGFQP